MLNTVKQLRRSLLHWSFELQQFHNTRSNTTDPDGKIKHNIMCHSIINSANKQFQVDSDNYIAYSATNTSLWCANNCNNGNNNKNIKCDINDYNSIFCNTSPCNKSVKSFMEY